MDSFHIAEYDEYQAKMDELKNMANFIPDASSSEGYEKSKRVHLDFRKVENAIEKVRKQKKSYFIEGGKQVDSQAKEIIKAIAELRIPHTEAYQEVDTIKKEAESKRKTELEARVSYLRDLPELMRDACSEEVKTALQTVQVEECGDFYEFTEQALKARNESREKLSSMFGEKLKAEKEAEELALLRKESEERARKDREDQIKREAAAKAEAEAKAAELAKIDAEKAKIEAEKRAIEAERRAAEAAELAKIEALAAAEKAKQDEINRQAALKQAEAEEQARKEANKQHVGKVRKAAKESLMAFVDEATAKKIVLAINAGEISNVTINY